jgi:hypothetical protein
LSEQLTLDDYSEMRAAVAAVRPDPRTLAHNSDPETSKTVAAFKRPTIRQRVAEILAANPAGLTDDEIHAAGTGTRHQHSTSTRRHELLQAGLVEQTDQRRLSVDGNNAVVWRWTGAK